MKFNQRHLTIALAVLVATVIYNVWALTRSAPTAPARQTPRLQNASAAQAPGTETDDPAIAPAKIPAPPAVDLDVAPAWGRDPFVNLTNVAEPEALPILASDPVVSSILYSSGRRAAIVDGRILGVGDPVRNGTIVAIERREIVVETPAGDQRRVGLRTSSASGGIRR